ncbi:acetate/propionate family kinase [Sphingomonas morindae]|uniref:Acetate kinase n=1 Tax=Sphingomonas morindae TaxID=1541170 RepID=A0ABY4XD60_9SPHN|nr:acetate/propionate family kinase [Sphingomonas morindae]USI74779.1 acetate/propionate family kinase [Sphingomonas morindae]
MRGTILALNSGSSSLKFALFEADRGARAARVRGQIEGIGATPHLIAKDAAGACLIERRWSAGEDGTHEALLGTLLDWIDSQTGAAELVGVGHRVVHGGRDFTAPVRVDAAVLAALEALCPLAPLHQPHALNAMRAVAAHRPQVAQTACFDTAFHATMAEPARHFALPPDLAREGVLRYGFHGLSYTHVAHTLADIDPALAAGRVVVAHLGAGASLCAMAGGRSVDTSMGFSALDGLVMATRPGALDPGVILYLLQHKHWSPERIETLLYKESGLKGLTGGTGDMRALLESTEPAAEAAIALFLWRLAQGVGAMAAALGGLDGLVFTGGIGEHAAPIRARACARLAWLGLALDQAANEAARPVISAPGAPVTVRIVPADEERVIADQSLPLLAETDR